MLSLEALLRLALYNKESNPNGTLPLGFDIWKTKPGDTLPVNALTDYRTLGRLINDYNTLFPECPQVHIDRRVVELRDAFAHGRISADSPDGNDFLVKFSKAVDSFVTVTDSQELSEVWLREQVRFVRDQVTKVLNVASS